ncbi:MAG: endonuclease [Myxococcaceae bacterium]|nr:endonuclease [Myxococcaceae bacterium]
MEGPSLVILREEMRPFVGSTIVEASGVAKQIEASSLTGQPLRWIKTWGKHFLLRIGRVTLRVHFLMWGSYRIDERKDRPPTLSMRFAAGEVNYYSSAIKALDRPVNELYDWRVDVMSRRWDARHVRALVKARPDAYVTDVLLDQDLFAGVGNIIKNEVLFRLGLHPETLVRDLAPRKLTSLVAEAHRYSHQFYAWKKEYALKKNWRIYRKRTCPDCGTRIVAKHMGRGERYTYHCPSCQPAPS